MACEENSTCDDNNACNGSETCYQHSCKAGEEPQPFSACTTGDGKFGYCNIPGLCIESTCRDANPCTVDGCTSGPDGCSLGCEIETGWTCTQVEPLSCATDCGDGIIAGDEECDDIWVSHGVDIISGNQHLGIGLNPDEVNGAEEYRTPQLTQDGLAWDKSHIDASDDSNAGVFTWSADHNEWAMLNDGQFHVVLDESWSDYKSSGDVSTTDKAILVNSNITLALQGDPNVCATKGGLDTAIQGLEEKLNSVGDDTQLANVDLQNMLQKQQQTLQMMSNIGKMLHDTAMAVIRKIGG